MRRGFRLALPAIEGLEPSFEAFFVTLAVACALPGVVADPESRTKTGFIKSRLVACYLCGGVLRFVLVHRPSLTR